MTVAPTSTGPAIPVEVGGRHILVTGSCGGIGRAITDGLRSAGAAVTGLDIAAGADVDCDVTRPEEVERALAEAGARHGPPDAVVLAAGRFPNRPFGQWSLSEFEELWRLNVGGSFTVLQAALPSLCASGRGRIVAISSSAVHQGVPGFACYAATKAALIGMIRSLAAEVAGSGVTANVITPGLTATEAALGGDVAPFFDQVVAAQMIGRRLQAQDLVGTVQLLCSDAAAMITGQTINIDAGAVTH